MKKMNYGLLLSAVIVGGAIGAFQVPATPASATSEINATTDMVLKTCRVTNSNGTTATIVATGKEVFLQNGTSLTLVSSDMHQGFIAVKTKVGSKFPTVSIIADDTNCLD
ncbi:MAG TPA: hypothetical protein PLL77_10415 [Pyrinomonadaceae bacterium]|nr:hypothetical protein [Pyrinomonadaceae bacterium]